MGRNWVPFRMFLLNCRRMSVGVDALSGLVSSLATTPLSAFPTDSSGLEEIIKKSVVAPSVAVSYLASDAPPSILKNPNLQGSLKYDKSLRSTDVLNAISNVRACPAAPETSQVLERLFRILSGFPLETLSSSPLLPLHSSYIYALQHNFEFPPDFQKQLSQIIQTKIRETKKVSELLNVLPRSSISEWTSSACSAAVDLIPSMSLSEAVNLFAAVANHKRRDFVLLNPLCRHIARQAQPLTARQCVSVASSCLHLRLKDRSLEGKLTADATRTVNTIEKWDDMRTLVRLFSWWRSADDLLWRRLCGWLDTRVRTSSASFIDLAAIVADLARLGRPEGESSALALRKKVSQERAPSAGVWLSVIHSLAFYRLLTPPLAESVLSKQFVQHLQSCNELSRPHLILKLLQVNACAETELEGYSGCSLNTSELCSNLKLEDVIRLRYGKAEKQRDSFREALSRVIPNPTASIHPSGVLVECIVRNTHNEPCAVLFVAGDRLSQSEEEEKLLGGDMIATRILSQKGVHTIVFSEREMAISGPTPVLATASVRRKLADVLGQQHKKNAVVS